MSVLFKRCDNRVHIYFNYLIVKNLDKFDKNKYILVKII